MFVRVQNSICSGKKTKKNFEDISTFITKMLVIQLQYMEIVGLVFFFDKNFFLFHLV